MTRLVLFFLLLATAFSQTPAPQSFQEQAPENVIHINVNLVQLDAVVTDSHGRQVTDLKPQDFQILQDGKTQSITNFTYIDARQLAQVAGRPSLPVVQGKGKTVPPPPIALRPENVRRTVALVVDDLGLSFESVGGVRQSLKNFIDKDMQPGDLVAIIRTGAGMGSLQQFTTDKRVLYAALDHVKYNSFGRVGPSSFAPLGSDDGTGETAAQERASIFAAGTLGAIRFVVDGLRELPGRKTLVLFSENLNLIQGKGLNATLDPRVMDGIRHLVDAANRASAVIYSIDPRGLQTYQLTAADDTRGMTSRQISRIPIERAEQVFRSQDGMVVLAHDTGGEFYHDRNDIPNLLHKAVEDSQGYYLLAYHPAASTFDPKTGAPRFHSVQVRVKVPGLTVRYRHGFYGTSDQLHEKAPNTPKAQIQRALFSPFGSAGIHLRLTALFTNTAAAGSYLNARLFIDARDLTFTDQPDGWHKAVFDVVAVTFGDSGQQVDSSGMTYTLQLKGDTYEQALRSGFFYKLQHPVKKPGYYQMRVALRDSSSGHVGAANQFIEIPNVEKGLTLSSLLLGKEPPQAPADTASAPGQTSPAQPPQDGDPKANPVVRIFKAGDSLDYAYQIIDLGADPSKPRDFQVHTRLFRDTQQIYEGKPMALQTIKQQDPKRMLGAGAIRLGPATKPGDYTLQVIVTEKNGDKQREASQAMDFEIEPSTDATSPPGAPKPASN